MDIFKQNVKGTADTLKNKTVGIAGCGGSGSNVAVALARSGVGNFVIADFDVVEYSNLNRQYFFLNDVGKAKVDALKHHLLNINPEIDISSFQKKLVPKDIIELFSEVDVLVEAFDKAEDKRWLIDIWCKNFPEKKIVCCSGIAGYGYTEKLNITKAGNIYLCGDGYSDINLGLSAPRVAIVANMQANIVLEILLGKMENLK